MMDKRKLHNINNQNYVTTEEVIKVTDLNNSNTIFTNVNILKTAGNNTDEKHLYQKYKPVVYNFINILISDKILTDYLFCGHISPDLHKSITTLLENTIFSMNDEDDELDSKIATLLNKVELASLSNLELKVKINGLLMSMSKEITNNPIYTKAHFGPIQTLYELNNMSQGS